MPMILIGPCMFFAPLLILLIPIALVLWPPALLLTGVAWLVLWPFARGGSSALARTHRRIGGWFRTLLTPWTFFDVPQPAQPASADVTPPGAAGARQPRQPDETHAEEGATPPTPP